MARILVLYGTTEGQTRKVAEFVCGTLRGRGHEVDLVDSATPAAGALQPGYAAAIVAGSLHEHLHQRALIHAVKANVAWLNAMPAAFISVSLAAAFDDAASQAEARHNLQIFLDVTGLAPRATLCLAGALRYTQYDWFKRTMMRLIARQRGGSTDPSHDHEYTDWFALTRFVEAFADTLGTATGKA